MFFLAIKIFLFWIRFENQRIPFLMFLEVGERCSIIVLRFCIREINKKAITLIMVNKGLYE